MNLETPKTRILTCEFVGGVWATNISLVQSSIDVRSLSSLILRNKVGVNEGRNLPSKFDDIYEWVNFVNNAL